MDHIAIMKKDWGLMAKIASGEKTIESRWYRTKHLPWDKITKGDKIFFKNSGEPITLSATVSKVKQIANLTPQKVEQILTVYGPADGISRTEQGYFYKLFKDKKYAILIFLSNIQKIKPFAIDKTGFGAMSAWISVEEVDKIKKGKKRLVVGIKTWKARSPATSMKYHNHRAEPYFSFLKDGLKTIEGRVRKGWYCNVKPGDSIMVYNEEETDKVNVIVKRVTKYRSIKEMLSNETIKKLLPDVDTLGQGVRVYRTFYTPEQEQKFGVVAIEVERKR